MTEWAETMHQDQVIYYPANPTTLSPWRRGGGGVYIKMVDSSCWRIGGGKSAGHYIDDMRYLTLDQAKMAFLMLWSLE